MLEDDLMDLTAGCRIANLPPAGPFSEAKGSSYAKLQNEGIQMWFNAYLLDPKVWYFEPFLSQHCHTYTHIRTFDHAALSAVCGTYSVKSVSLPAPGAKGTHSTVCRRLVGTMMERFGEVLLV